MSPIVSQRHTQFAESDAAGVIHFSNYARYVEEAEHLFLSQSGFPIQLNKPGALLWPRMEFTARYLRPVVPMETIQIELEPLRIGRSSIRWGWSIWRKERTEEVAQGEMKTVCCMARGTKMETIEIPPELRKKLNEPSLEA